MMAFIPRKAELRVHGARPLTDVSFGSDMELFNLKPFRFPSLIFESLAREREVSSVCSSRTLCAFSNRFTPHYTILHIHCAIIYLFMTQYLLLNLHICSN